MFKIPVPAARRAGMLAAGITLWLGFALFVLACIELSAGRALTSLPQLRPHEVLVLVWLAATVIGLVAYQLVRARPTLFREVGAQRAFTVPATAAAMWMPLTLHFVFAAAFERREGFANFDMWAAISLAVTAVAHLWFAAQVHARAVALVVGFPPTKVARIYGTTIVAGLIPGVIFLGFPCLVIAITGLPILPMLHAMERYAAYDRGAAWVPLARVVIA